MTDEDGGYAAASCLFYIPYIYKPNEIEGYFGI